MHVSIIVSDISWKSFCMNNLSLDSVYPRDYDGCNISLLSKGNVLLLLNAWIEAVVWLCLIISSLISTDCLFFNFLDVGLLTLVSKLTDVLVEIKFYARILFILLDSSSCSYIWSFLIGWLSGDSSLFILIKISVGWAHKLSIILSIYESVKTSFILCDNNKENTSFEPTGICSILFISYRGVLIILILSCSCYFKNILFFGPFSIHSTSKDKSLFILHCFLASAAIYVILIKTLVLGGSEPISGSIINESSYT